jgi:transposase
MCILGDMKESAKIRRKYMALAEHLDERARRIWAATEAEALGYGGISLVARATGISRRAIHGGLTELKAEEAVAPDRIRKPGGGRKPAIHHHPDLADQLERLVEPLTRGDPSSPLRWTCKSVRLLADELRQHGIRVGRQTVATQLHALGYSLQGNRKTVEGQQHPDRNAQFEHINARVTQEMKAGNPVISVDTKKKELVGNYKNSGRQWHRTGKAPQVNIYDFPSPDVARAHPYGVYDLAKNRGFVNVGTDHDTATFAVASIRKWWRAQGKRAYTKAKRLLITADAGGSNGSRLRLWKWELQRLANELGIPISVCHFPPGTSKWNKVEHRLFSFISQNWRGEPLTDYETVVNLIAHTTTTTGLKVSCRLDRRRYPTGRKVSDEEWAKINLHRDDFHGDWNYEIRPQQ